MKNRRHFIKTAGTLAAGSILLPSFASAFKKVGNVGMQLYTVRNEMVADAVGTLKKVAALGIKQLESARSTKGYYYGLKPKEMANICSDLGMTLRSGHVGIDKNWKQVMNDAVESGQEYLICSSMPTTGQTVDNYKSVAEVFNKVGEECKTLNLKFGYHNHDYEFESENGQVLYDILVEHTDPALVNMELDLGWVAATGHDPIDYINRYPGRFPLWHLKDMDFQKKYSVEFGKGGLKILEILKLQKKSGLKYFFVEQEEYASTPFESMQQNMRYLGRLRV